MAQNGTPQEQETAKRALAQHAQQRAVAAAAAQQQQQQQQQAAPKSKLASSLDTMHRIKRAYSSSGSRGAPPQRKPSYSGNGDAGNGYSTPQRPPPEEEHMITIKVGWCISVTTVHTGVTHCSKRQGSRGVWLCGGEGSCK